jgi:acyl-CoA:acyl-CoA alkyltransferase
MHSSFSNVSIHSLSHLAGPHILSNASIEERLSSTYSRLGFEKGMIEKVTGILERRYWEDSMPPSEIATLVATSCIKKAGISMDEIGLLINT